MKLTTHTDYALRLLIYLAVRSDEMPATVQAAAAHYGISAHHLAKVAQTLVQLGYVASLRGRGGGLRLQQPAEEIGIGALVRQTENLELLECFGPESTCPIEPGCRLKGVLAKAQQAFLAVLDGYVLADLVENRQQLRVLLGHSA
ncbi:Rrf2 family transcriptional regulator [Salinicola acroporae]|uniref:Rrf2 family transcriptional regulator n=1 Tax=Salinicola acroporae TaxID=1541440 RepID=A0ABT6I4D7_9GAMM|nr:Rrf2 family transcriptional regulator [Salinicola acroporae]MDH4572501.1 Rrf2 family transcriptional regulator [Salinicola acroporae]